MALALPCWAKDFGDGRAGDVRVQNGALPSPPGHARGQQGRDQGLAHAALAAHDRHHLAHTALGVRFDAKVCLLRLAVCTLLAAGTARMVALFAHGKLPF